VIGIDAAERAALIGVLRELAERVPPAGPAQAPSMSTSG
jgi:hypothetical protein